MAHVCGAGRQLNTKSPTIKHGCPRTGRGGGIEIPEVRKDGDRLVYVKWMTIPLPNGAAAVGKTLPQYYLTYTSRGTDDTEQSKHQATLRLSYTCTSLK